MDVYTDSRTCFNLQHSQPPSSSSTPLPLYHRCQANHWGKKGDPDRHKVMCKALRKGAASGAPPSASSSGGGGPASASGGANWRGHASGGGGGGAGSSSDPPATIPITVGCRVQIAGVKSKPELNGAQGDVTAKDTKKDDRWHVVPHGKAAAASFSRSNLTVLAAASTGRRAAPTLPLEVGCKVEISGVKSNVALNGAVGIVVSSLKLYLETAETRGH